MKLKFDANLDYQIEATSSVVDLFEGLPPKEKKTYIEQMLGKMM